MVGGFANNNYWSSTDVQLLKNYCLFEQTINIRFSGIAEIPTILRILRKVQDPLSPPPKAQLLSWAFFMSKTQILKVHYPYI